MKIYKTVLGRDSEYRTITTCQPETLRVGRQGHNVVAWYEVGDTTVNVEIAYTGYPHTLPVFVGTVVLDDRVCHVYREAFKSEQNETIVTSDPKPATTVNTMPVKAVHNGLAFYYRKMNNDTRLVRVNHIQFNVVKNRQVLNGYDLDRKALRTFYLDQIVAFCEVDENL